MKIWAKSKGTDFLQFQIKNFGFSSIKVSKHGYDKLDTHNKACLICYNMHFYALS